MPPSTGLARYTTRGRRNWDFERHIHGFGQGPPGLGFPRPPHRRGRGRSEGRRPGPRHRARGGVPRPVRGGGLAGWRHLYGRSGRDAGRRQRGRRHRRCPCRDRCRRSSRGGPHPHRVRRYPRQESPGRKRPGRDVHGNGPCRRGRPWIAPVAIAVSDVQPVAAASPKSRFSAAAPTPAGEWIFKTSW